MEQPLIPVFKGESYELWSIRMKTILKFQDLWDLVERGYTDSDEENWLRDNKKKDAKALVFIQQAVRDNVFSRIATKTTSKQAWSILQREFQGDSKVIVQVEVDEKEDFAVVEVVVMEEAEEEILVIGIPMNKETQKMAFNVIIAITMGI
uniref:Uncharacterized protein n=1 Tax=Solanum lycopersicum TaxID=4081 RepID=A0A3Q7HM55_SOLLC